MIRNKIFSGFKDTPEENRIEVEWAGVSNSEEMRRLVILPRIRSRASHD